MTHPWRMKLIAACLSLSLASILSSCSKNPQTSDQVPNDSKPGLLGGLFDSTKPVTVPEGTVLTVALDQSISSADNRSGDSFAATLVSPIVVDGKTVIPQDAPVRGHVADAQASGRLSGVARLALTLDSVDVNGKSYDIQTSDFGKGGKNHNKRNAALIGGGAGAGTLIGALAGGGKGALIGGALGAGAGTGAAAYTGKKDIRLRAETTLSFRLARPVTIQTKS